MQGRPQFQHLEIQVHEAPEIQFTNAQYAPCQFLQQYINLIRVCVGVSWLYKCTWVMLNINL